MYQEGDRLVSVERWSVAEVLGMKSLHLSSPQVGGSPEETRKQTQQEANLPLI